jgi:hypothetical protein
LICLNKDLLLTHGNPIGFSALLLRLKPSHESYTAVFENPNSSKVLVGQVNHTSGSRSARINFILVEEAQETHDLPALIEFLCCKAGEMTAISVLAEVEETLPIFESLRRSGFNVYGWETVWKFPKKLAESRKGSGNWVPATTEDDAGIRMLYQLMVPPLVQTVEPFTNGRTPRLVYKNAGEVVAYVESTSGPDGLYLKPVIHPSVENINMVLSELVMQFIDIQQPLYLQVRSYQAWLLANLQVIGGEESNRFTLLVKHLAIMQRNGVIVTQRSRTDRRQAEPTVPIVTNFVEDGLQTKNIKQSKISNKGLYDPKTNY